MNEVVYNALSNYFHALELKGYIPYPQTIKLLVLCFYRDFVYNDYRGVLSKEDYRLIERALNCLYGTTCLIPYPDYLKMGKLHLGEITEMAYRVNTLEETEVVKSIDAESTDDSDILLVTEDKEN